MKVLKNERDRILFQMRVSEESATEGEKHN